MGGEDTHSRMSDFAFDRPHGAAPGQYDPARMAIFGAYETVQELSRSGLGSVYSARKAGTSDAPVFAVKTCSPDAAIIGDEAVGAFIARFLEGAETSRRIGDTITSGRWGKVYQLGRADVAAEDGAVIPGAFFVTDLATRGTMERLAAGKVQFDSPVLSRLIGEVVCGLCDLQSAMQRGHGNLKPSNVLVCAGAAGNAAKTNGANVGVSELLTLRVLLADPLPGDRLDAERDRLADLRAVGELIHILVLHQKFRGGWPLEHGGPWKALGRDGEKWRDLVNRLLDPDDKASRPGLDELALQVSQLKTVRRSRTPMVIGAIAAALLIGGGTTTYLLTRGPAKPEIKITLWNETREKDWIGLCNAHRGWYTIFQSSLNKAPAPAQGQFKTRREGYAAGDAQLAALVTMQGAGEGFDPWSIAQGSETTVKPERDLNDLSRAPGDYARSDWGVERTEQALKAIASLSDGLAAWEAPRKLKTRAEEWRALGWNKAAAYLDQVADGVSIEQSPDLAGAIDTVLAVVPASERAQQLWTQIQEHATEMKKAKDPVLDKFAPAAAALGGGAGEGAGSGTRADLDALLAQLQTTAELSGRLAGFVRVELATIDAESFTNAPAYGILTSAAPARETFEEWLKEARKWPSLKEPDPRMALDFDALFVALEAQAKRLTTPPLNEKLDAETAVRLAKVKPEWEAVDRAKVGWNRRNQQRVEGETARIKTELEDLRIALEGKINRRMVAIREGAASARKMLNERVQIVADSPSINGIWKNWRDAIVGEYADEQYEDMVARAQATEDALVGVRRTALGATLPAPEGGAAPAAWMLQLNGAVDAERERRISAWAQELAAKPPAAAELRGEAFTSRVDATARAYTQWLDKLVQMRTDLGKVEDLLSQGIAPGAGGGSGGADGAAAEQLWTKWSTDPIAQDGAIKQAMSSLSTRIDAAKALAGEKDAGKLVTTIRDAAIDRPELVIGAWNRLADQTTGWPGSAAQLGEARAVREKLDLVGNGLPAQRKAALAQRVASEMGARWKAFAASAREVADLQAAFAAMSDFGVAEADLEPRTRYNLLVSRLKAEAQNKTLDDPAVMRLVGDFSRDVRGLSGDVSSSAKVNALLSSLQPLATGDAPKEKPIDPLTLGPGKVWGAQSGQLIGSGEGLVFQRGGLRLEFVRVDPPAPADPAFICTRELSIGEFAEIAAAMPAIADAAPAAEHWKGPRGWTRTANGAYRAGAWINPDAMFSAQQPAYAPSIVAPGQAALVGNQAGGEPTSESPMQSVSAVAMAMAARAVGCRFPTEVEWKTAYQKFAGGAVPATANLRDATFEAQKQHVRAMQDNPAVQRKVAFQWPDDETYGFVFLETPKGANARVGPTNDGVLWFAKVTSDPGPVHHLVGNVAELVCANGPQMERVPATSAQEIESLGAGIIGGSALSDPTQNAAQVLPVSIIDVEEGLADVGCRLAFGAKGVPPPRETFIARLGKMMTDDAYLLGQ